MGQERRKKISQGGLEDVYSELFSSLRTDPNRDRVYLQAGLTQNQYQCIEAYLENPNFKAIQTKTEIARSNIYPSLYAAITKIEIERRRNK